jgi:hypothetical protein
MNTRQWPVEHGGGGLDVAGNRDAEGVGVEADGYWYGRVAGFGEGSTQGDPRAVVQPQTNAANVQPARSCIGNLPRQLVRSWLAHLLWWCRETIRDGAKESLKNTGPNARKQIADLVSGVEWAAGN